MPNYKVENAIDAMLKAVEAAAREHAAYDADPHERKADQEEFRARIDARKNDAVARARATLTAEAETVHGLYERLRKTSFDEAGVAAAWKRIEALLETGRGLDEVIERASFSRNEAEAIRREYAAWMARRLPEARPVDIERRVMPDLFRVQKAEIALMDRAEAEATTAEHERLATADVVRVLDKMAVEAAATGKVSSQAMLEVGYAQRAAGIAPPTKDWSEIVREVDPEAAAKAARNSAAPELRDALNRNARDVSFRPAPGTD
jgi:hypothetical protein